MTPEQAKDLVEDLMQAHHDYETFGGRDYREDYHEMKRRVIEALTASPLSRPHGDTP